MMESMLMESIASIESESIESEYGQNLEYNPNTDTEKAIQDEESIEEEGYIKEDESISLSDADDMLEEANQEIEHALDNNMLENRIRDLEAKLEHQKKLALADVQNARKEEEKYRQEAIKYAATKVVEDFIPLIDTFDMALQYTTSESDSQGLKMLKDQFLKVLNKNGVTEIKPEIGIAFDPKQHESVGYQESEDFAQDSIAKVMQAGYKIHDRIIRAARVMLVKNS